MAAQSGEASISSPALRMRNDRGVVLLEVLVALVILATGGVGLVELVGAGLRAERDARGREATLATEERLLSALTLLNRRDLDQRIGRSEIGEFIVDVQRPEPTLFRVALLQQRSPTVEDLVTVVYRSEVRP
jgi:type II secretory pathway component PulJ